MFSRDRGMLCRGMVFGLLWAGAASGGEHAGQVQRQWTIGELGRGIEAADAMLRSRWRLEYRIESPIISDGARTGLTVRHIRHVENMAEGWLRHELTSRQIKEGEPQPGDDGGAADPQLVVSYDGNVTVHLDNVVNSRGQRRAIIWPGRNDAAFAADNDSSAMTVRRYGRNVSYAKVFEDSGSQLRVVEQDARMDGIRCVKVEGTLLEGGMKLELWIAPEKGMLPLWHRISGMKPENASRSFERKLSDLVEVIPGIWFPRRIEESSSASQEKLVTIIKSIGTEEQRRDEFAVVLPPQTVVNDLANKTVYRVAEGGNDELTEEERADRELQKYMERAAAQRGTPATRPAK